MNSVMNAAAIAISVLFLCGYLQHRRYVRLDQAYEYIGDVYINQGRLTMSLIPALSRERVLNFLSSCLNIPPEQSLDFNHIQRLLVLWSGLGDDTKLCYGILQDYAERHSQSKSSQTYETIWIEFRFEKRCWVFWYDTDGMKNVRSRRSFYRKNVVTHMEQQASFCQVGDALFKPHPHE